MKIDFRWCHGHEGGEVFIQDQMVGTIEPYRFNHVIFRMSGDSFGLSQEVFCAMEKIDGKVYPSHSALGEAIKNAITEAN